MQAQLAKKLMKDQAGKDYAPDLSKLIQLDREQKIFEESKQDAWLKMITQEREELQAKRVRQEDELENILNTSAIDVFSNTADSKGNMMISQKLKQRLDKRKEERNNKEKNNKWQISIMAPWRKKWDYIIILAAIISVIFIPIRFAVNRKFGGLPYFIVDIISYIMYCSDILISLRTTYIDSFGEEIRDDSLIIKRYLTSPVFWIDFFSLFNVPSYTYTADNMFNFFGILKVVRITRLQKLITQSHFQKGYKVFLKIIYNFTLFIFYLHLAGCLWFAVIENVYKNT